MDYADFTGRIFDIQRFSVHDGPGVRTIVFLKGCLLRCRWCCNPESQLYDIQTMVMDGKPKTVGRDVTVREAMQPVLDDYPYYRRSGGGLTLSGGEMLLQPQFARGLLMYAHRFGINTAVETTGCAPFEVIEELLPHIDYVLMDIKHMDGAKHKAFTTKDNSLILENAPKIAARAGSMTVRVPVIPTFNDTEAEIAEIARFAASLPNVRQIHLLPYHRLGTDKYAGLGRTYTLMGLTPPDDGKMAALQRAAEAAGIQCQIGG